MVLEQMIKTNLKKIKSGIKDYIATFYIKRINAKVSRKNIRVAFIVQMPEIWDKEESVYEEFCRRDEVDAFLIIVPSYDINNKKLKSYGVERKFFKHRYAQTIDAVDKDGNIIDLKSYKIDYVFYQRPYEHYLPKKLQGSYVVKFAKICYIPYAFWPFFDAKDIGYNRTFFRNVYFGFMDTLQARETLYNEFYKNCKKGYQHFEYMGYPVLEKYLEMKSVNKFQKVVWTPRWATDMKIGGNHFMQYKDDFISLADEYPNMNLILRPHPLAFDNYVASGIMTDEELKVFKRKLEKKHIEIDYNSMVDETFKDTDILISDISSIMIMFYLIGKPIIYCPTDIKICETYNRLLPGMYIANNWKEVKRYLQILLEGNDYLYEKRQQVIKSEFAGMRNIASAIVDRVMEDFNESNKEK